MIFEHTIEKLLLPPTKSNGSTRQNDTIEIVNFGENPFPQNVIFMSDMHSHSQAVIEHLKATIELDKYYVVTLGDMWGNYTRGADGDPTHYYRQFLEYSAGLYIIQGNHDLPPSDPSILDQMRNKDKTYCFLKNGIPQETCLGKIGGVHGTTSEKKHPYKMPEKEYIRHLKKLENLDILLTHDTPAIMDNQTEKSLIGRVSICQTICGHRKKKGISPKYHVYGHCHHPMINVNNNIVFLNADSRVLIFTKKI